MRKVIVGAMVSLDGVMQAPGGPEEDPTGGFKYGGWVAGYWDEALGRTIGENFATPFDLLLGRRTYDIFAAYWPYRETSADPGTVHIAKRFNAARKYVATHRPDSLAWQNSHGLGNDVAAGVRELKKVDGPALLTQGSTELLHLLFKHDLVDELNLTVFPLLLGKGKRLFDDGSAPGSLKLLKSDASPSGALIARYGRGGEVKTGNFAVEAPSATEIERRKTLR
jgi:dihydrofolate reductase